MTGLERGHRFADQALRILRERILSGELALGERLNEAALAEAFGISRGPLREALNQLASEGLVTIIAHRGSFVRSFTYEELRNLYELRTALECFAARKAAEHVGDELVSSIDQLLKETSDALSEGQGDGYPTALDFHEQVIALAGNPELLDAWRSVSRRISVARSRSGRTPGRAQEAMGEHQSIVEAIKAGDGAEAARRMAAHMARSFENVTDHAAI